VYDCFIAAFTPAPPHDLPPTSLSAVLDYDQAAEFVTGINYFLSHAQILQKKVLFLHFWCDFKRKSRFDNT
jgi:hypothetical protein